MPWSSCLAFVLLLSVSISCRHLATAPTDFEPVRVSQLTEEGDAARRASMRLVVEGLDADELGQVDRAQARYQRALSVDVTNPYAYLAIARHHIEAGEPDLALQFLERADSLLRMNGDVADEIEVHLEGLRGAALYDAQDFEAGALLLDRARQKAPRVWGDGTLEAEELR